MADTLLVATCLLFVTVVGVHGVETISDPMDKSFDTPQLSLIKDSFGRSALEKVSPRYRRKAEHGGTTWSASDIYEMDDPGSPATFNTTILKTNIPAGPKKKTIDVPVDNTITELIINVTAQKGQPTPELREPFGRLIPMLPGSFGNVSLQYIPGGVQIITIKNPAAGTWELSKAASPISWTVEVTAKSTIDFTTKFKQMVNGVEKELTGRPTTGENVTVVITVPSVDKIGGMNVIILTNQEGAGLDMARLVQGKGADKSVFTGTVSFPKKPFQLTISGTDSDGNQIQRLDTSKTISPVAIKLAVGKLGPLYVDEDLTIPYTVENMGDRSTVVTVDIKDNKGLIGSAKQNNYTLAAGQNKTGSYTMHAGKTLGVKITVTLTAQAVSVAGATPHHEIRKFTVERRPDKTKPVCNVTSVTGSCSASQMDPCSCHKYTWSATAEFGDVGYGLLEVSSTLGKSGFTSDKFTKGDTIDKGAKKATIKSDCCHPIASIDVVDMANNTGKCKFDLAPGLTKPAAPCTTTLPPSTASPVDTTAKTAPPAKLATTATPAPVVTAAPAVLPAVHGNSTTDTVPPVCKVNATHGHCTKEQVKPEVCDDHVWYGTVSFGDEGSGLYMVKSTEGESGTLTTDTFAIGDTIDKGMKTAKLITTCCYSVSYVIIVDVAGNSGQCKMDVGEPEFKLSPGAIAGISVGAVAVLAGAILAAVLITKYGRCPSSTTPETNTGRFRKTAWD